MDSLRFSSCTGDNDLAISDWILDLILTRPLWIWLLWAEVVAQDLAASVLVGGITGTSLNGTFGSATTCGRAKGVEYHSWILLLVAERYSN